VTIHYAFTAVGGATPPTTTTITVYLGIYPYYVAGSGRSFDVDTSQRLEGDIQYTIPATASDTADMPLTAVTPFGSSSTTLYVRPSAGASPAGGAASTATWGLVLAVLALFVAGFALMKRPASPGGESRSSGFKVSEDEPPKPRDRVMFSDGGDEKRLPFTAEGDKKEDPPKSL
jgi:hypothetical protein